MRYEETRYGFNWGAADITRIWSSPKGHVCIDVNTKRESLEIVISPTGFIRFAKKKNKREAKP